MMRVPKIAEDLREAIQKEIDEKTKPLGSLGQIEALALQLALIQGSLRPEIRQPTLIVMAGDHGIARAGVSPYPQAVTEAMMHNFARGGAAINVFTKQLGWQLELIDCGTVGGHDIEGVFSLKIGPGTVDFREAPAMSEAQLERCFREGEARAKLHASLGCNTLGFGEMGIGNTSSAALLIHCLSDLSLDVCINRGAGCDDPQLDRKYQLLREALSKHGRIADPYRALQTYGGFEVATMTGAMLEAGRNRMTILVDGFIASAAALVAIRLDPGLKPYLVFAHESGVQGHRQLLASLDAQAVLKLSMRLGEGTAAALALPLLQCAAAMLRDMATFSSASIPMAESR